MVVDIQNRHELMGHLKNRHAVSLRELSSILNDDAQDIHTQFQPLIKAGLVACLSPVGSRSKPTDNMYYRLAQSASPFFPIEKKRMSLTQQATLHPRWTAD